jgi:hypothetical protein
MRKTKVVDKGRLEAVAMWTWRRMENTRWSDRITNEEVLGRVGEER